MVTKKDIAVAILATFCLTSTLFMIMPIQSQSGVGEYDHWMDINDDGIIDIFDIAAVAIAFGAEGAPINKTELLLSLLSQVENLGARVGTLEAKVANLMTALVEHEARIAALEAKLQSLYIDGSITMSGSVLSELLQSISSTTLGQGLLWLAGTDAPEDVSVEGCTVTVDLDVEAGILVNFTECLFLKNDNATGSFSLELSVARAVSESDFSTCKMHIYANLTEIWTHVNTLDLTNAADTCSGTLGAGDYLRIGFEVDAATSASGNKPFDIQVRYS